MLPGRAAAARELSRRRFACPWPRRVARRERPLPTVRDFVPVRLH
jgi:hypothetical protein